MACARLPLMVTFTSHSPDETLALGETWGRQAWSGWIVGLQGELGAGKTQLVKGIARGLEIKTRVQSPTFPLVHEYGGGRLPLAHLDLYRLDTPEQIIGAGLSEYFRRPSGVVVIEWCERWPEFSQDLRVPKSRPRELDAEAVDEGAKAGARSPCLRLVWLESISESARRILYEDFGD